MIPLHPPADPLSRGDPRHILFFLHIFLSRSHTTPSNICATSYGHNFKTMGLHKRTGKGWIPFAVKTQQEALEDLGDPQRFRIPFQALPSSLYKSFKLSKLPVPLHKRGTALSGDGCGDGCIPRCTTASALPGLPALLHSCQRWDAACGGGNCSAAKYRSDAWRRARPPLLGRTPLQTGLSRTTAPGRAASPRAAQLGRSVLLRMAAAAGQAAGSVPAASAAVGTAWGSAQPASCLPLLLLSHSTAAPNPVLLFPHTGPPQPGVCPVPLYAAQAMLYRRASLCKSCQNTGERDIPFSYALPKTAPRAARVICLCRQERQRGGVIEAALEGGLKTLGSSATSRGAAL